jgi:hypothetical protein
MVTLQCDAERTEGVTLVGLVVEADRPTRVRVENRLDGPVWPPRSEGRPVAGWDDDGVTSTVDGRLSLGYATPAHPSEPAAEVVSTEAVGPEATPDAPGCDASGSPPGNDGAAPPVESTPAGVVRALGDPVVPRDCVPVPDDGSTAGTEGSQSGATAPTGPDCPGTTAPESDAGNPGWADSELERSEDADLFVPAPVRAWLADVERRLDAAREDGDLDAAVAADRRALSRTADRIDELRASAGERSTDGRR